MTHPPGYSGISCGATPQPQRPVRPSNQSEWLGAVVDYPHLTNDLNPTRGAHHEISAPPPPQLHRSGSSRGLKESGGGQRSLSTDASSRCKQMLPKRGKVAEAAPGFCNSCSTCGGTQTEARACVSNPSSGMQHSTQNLNQLCSGLPSRNSTVRSRSLRESTIMLHECVQHPPHERSQKPFKSLKASQNGIECRKPLPYNVRNSEPPSNTRSAQQTQCKSNTVQAYLNTQKTPMHHAPQNFPFHSRHTASCTPGSDSLQTTHFESPGELTNRLLDACAQSQQLSSYTTSAVCTLASAITNTFESMSNEFRASHLLETSSTVSSHNHCSSNKPNVTGLVDYSPGFPAKQTSMDEISMIVGAQRKPYSSPLTVPKRLPTTLLPNSHSAGSNLSTVDEKPFYDSGISSSSYSKDSACTSPAENSINKPVVHQVNGNQDLSLSWQNPAARTDGDQRSTDYLSYSGCNANSGPRIINDSVQPAKSTEPSLHLCNQPMSGGGKSKLLPPSSAMHPTSPYAQLSSGMDPIKLISRHKASELYSLVKSREDARKNSTTRGSEHQNVLKTESSSQSSKCNSVSLRPQGLTKQAITHFTGHERNTAVCSESKTVSTTALTDGFDYVKQLNTAIKCQSHNSNSNRHFQEHNTVTTGDEKHDNPICVNSQPSRSDGIPLPTENVSSALTSHQSSVLQQQCTTMKDLTGDNCDANSHNGCFFGTDAVDLVTAASKTSLGADIDLPIANESKETAITDKWCKLKAESNKAVSDSDSKLIDPIELVCNSNDPEQLLSSLSKLTLDGTNKSSLWDDNYYFSDVESDYAALELVLPFNTSPKESRIVNRSPDTNLEPVVEKSHELGYFSDTEAVLQAPASLSSPSGNTPSKEQRLCADFQFPRVSDKFSIASCVPMVATPKHISGSANSIASSARSPDAQSGVRIENSSTRGMHLATGETRWPRLKSARSFTHSMFRGKLTAGEISLTASESKLYKPIKPEQLKLPYPMVPVMGSRGLSPHSPTSQMRSSGSANALKMKTVPSEAEKVTENQTNTSERNLLTPDILPTGGTTQWPEAVESLRSELRQMTQQLTTLTFQLTRKDREIDRLRNTVSKLQCDMQRQQQSQPLVHCTGDEKLPRQSGLIQEIQETLSLHSLTSGTSLGSQESFKVFHTGEGDSGPPVNHDIVNETEGGAGKRPRWTRPSLGKAFKRRSKSSMDSGEHSTASSQLQRVTNAPTATVSSNPRGSREESQWHNRRCAHADASLQEVPRRPKTSDPMQALLKKMCWEMSCLEADNQRLRLLVLNSPPSTESAADMKDYRGADISVSGK
ncbi:unnamed protein product [Dicrocoelium dendriticum]|nr:unnamed protein product [Dicrocoelium dendriticum]